MASKACVGCPLASEVNKTQTWPTAASPLPNAQVPNELNGEKALTNKLEATPAAMNNDTPEPKPHLLTTSSMYIIKNPPINNWKMRINCANLNVVGDKLGEGAKPPIST